MKCWICKLELDELTRAAEKANICKPCNNTYTMCLKLSKLPLEELNVKAKAFGNVTKLYEVAIDNYGKSPAELARIHSGTEGK